MNLTELNRTYGISGILEFSKGEGGFPNAVITSQKADAVVSLYGAHVLSYHPQGKQEVFWMSGKSYFEAGKPIRGGIPICFPWFGPHSSDPKKPQHGFARLRAWDVSEATLLDGGEVELHLTLTDSSETRALWPYAFALELVVIVGSSIDVSLRCTNTGSEAFTYTDALHSYFSVSDIGAITISGLGGCAYIEAPSAVPQRQEEDLLEIRKEVNRRYLSTAAECMINDAPLGRTIRVAKKGSMVTVVWNPWEATAKTIADMPDEGFKTMICIEAANALDDVVTLQPGASFCLATVISVD